MLPCITATAKTSQRINANYQLPYLYDCDWSGFLRFMALDGLPTRMSEIHSQNCHDFQKQVDALQIFTKNTGIVVGEISKMQAWKKITLQISASGGNLSSDQNPYVTFHEKS